MKNIIKFVGFGLLVVSIVALTCVCSCIRYNNGACRSCEAGELTFVNATSRNEATEYVFACENCEKVYTFAINPPWFN